MIAKFTLSTAHVLFSRNAIVSRFDGVPTLMFRVANLRNNQIIEAHMRLTLLRDDETAEGERYRRMLDLPLVRDSSPFFALSWTVMHPIDEASPFYGMGPDHCRSEATQMVAVLTGIDCTIRQPVKFAPEPIEVSCAAPGGGSSSPSPAVCISASH